MGSLARALAVAAALALLAAGCSLVPKKPEQIPPTPGTPLGANQGKVGDSIRLSSDTAAMRVRVLRVLDPLPVGPGDKPFAHGARFVGIEAEFENVGPAVYDEAPLSGSTLVTGSGTEIDGESVLGGPCAARFPSNLRVLPGRKREDCLVFEVPAGEDPVSFTFGLDSGFAAETGKWKLR